MKKLLTGVCALALAGALSGVAHAETVFVQAGKLMADPATCKVETAKTLVLENGKVTLLYGAHDEKHNNAVALAAWLRKQE